MTIEERTYTVYSWDDLPEEGKAKALEKYRDINLDTWEPEQWIDTDFARDVLTLPSCYELLKIGYCISYGQGDGASGKLDVTSIKDVLNYYLHRLPKLRHLLKITDWLSSFGGNENHSYRNYTHYSYIGIELDDHSGRYERIESVLNSLEELMKEDCVTFNSELFLHLRKDYEYLQDDEAVIDTLKASEFMFTIDGCID